MNELMNEWQDRDKVRGGADVNAEDSRPKITEKKLKRVKVGKWRSLTEDTRQHQLNNDESVTTGRLYRTKYALTL